MKRYIRSAYCAATGQRVDDDVMIDLLVDKYRDYPLSDSLLRELERLYNIEIAYAVYRKIAQLYRVTASEEIYAAAKFDTSSTGTSYYDNFLNEKDLQYMQKAKNLTGQVVMMSPLEYFKECAETIFQGKFTVDDLKKQRFYSHSNDGKRLIEQYQEDMERGDVFPLCYLNYASNNQEGLHRMYAAGEAFGWDEKYPVLIVKPYDMNEWNNSQLLQEIRDFERYEFDDIVSDVERDLEDWSSPVPEDIEDRAKEYVEKHAKLRGHDIEVWCEIKDHDGDDRLEISLMSYDGHKIEDPEPSRKSPWLANMFETDSDSDEDLDIDEELIEDLDDEDLADFLGKMIP